MTENEKAEFFNDPQRWNRYIYAIDNPLKYTDPLGLYVCDTNALNKTQCQQIQKGLENNRDHGNKEQKRVANWLLDKKNKTVITLDNNDSNARVNNSNGANALIQRGNATVNEASEFLTIAIKPGNFNSDEALEGTLVHEGRHSWVQANIITSFSNGDSVSEDITRYRDELLARDTGVKYLRDRGGKYATFAVNLGQLKSDKITVNEQSIRQQIATDYKDPNGQPLTDKNQGVKVSAMFGLIPHK